MHSGFTIRFFLLPALLLASQLQAQSGEWANFVEGWKTRHEWERERAPLTLLAIEGTVPPDFWQRNEDLQHLAVEGDVTDGGLTAEDAIRVSKAREWGTGPHWILLDRQGVVAGEGTTLPTAEELQAALRSRGFQPTWEAREAFLREHPDNGDALQARLGRSLAFVQWRFRNLVEQKRAVSYDQGPDSQRVPGKILDPADADDVFHEAAETLERLSQLPDGWRMGDRSLLGLRVQTFGGFNSPRMRLAMKHMGEAILEAWRRNPHSGSDIKESIEAGARGLGSFWMTCERIARGEERPPELPDLVAVPGRTVLNRECLSLAWEFYAPFHDWESLKSFLESLPLDPPAGPISADRWKDYTQLCGAVCLYQAHVLGELGRWSDALEALQASRHWLGEQWKAATEFTRDRFVSPSGTPGTPADERSKPPSAFLEVLALEAEPEPRNPAQPEALSMVLWGSPAWKSAWEKLRNHPALIAWGPEDWNWTVAVEGQERLLKNAGYEPPRWAAFQGASKVLASGDALPDPRLLALQLSAAGPTSLQRLDAFIAKHPEHLDAKRERYALLRSRMPNPLLEAKLMEDAATAWMPLDFAPDASWISDAKAWQVPAKRVLAEVEIALRRWPRNPLLWRTWISWAAFHSKPPSVLAFSESLSVSRARNAWISSLPAAVHRAVAKECREAKRGDRMLAWFQAAWDGMEPTADRMDTWLGPGMSREEAIHEGLAEALKLQKRTVDLAELEQKWNLRKARKD